MICLIKIQKIINRCRILVAANADKANFQTKKNLPFIADKWWSRLDKEVALTIDYSNQCQNFYGMTQDYAPLRNVSKRRLPNMCIKNGDALDIAYQSIYKSHGLYWRKVYIL